MWRLGGAFLIITCLQAEVRTLTLQQAIDLALKQSPDITMARLDEQKAEQSVRLARSPFFPKVAVGSGAAYSSGFPMSIEGATPSIFQAQAVSYVFNRQQNFRIAAAKEARRGSALDSASKRDVVAHRTAELYFDLERVSKQLEAARQQIETLERVTAAVAARVAEGRELPLESKKAALNVAKAKYRLQSLEAEFSATEGALSAVLGLNPGDQIRASSGERPAPPLPASEQEAIKSALEHSHELRLLESRLIAKGFDIRAERAARLPRLDLVAQYGLLAKFNNYEEFFQKFQRHNGQLGVSFQLPLFTGPGASAAIQQAETESAQLRLQMQTARSRIAADTRRLYRELARAQGGQEVSRLDLEVTREQVSVLLAQMQEGRAGLREVEEARFAESEKWMEFYDAGAVVEKARLNLLRETGGLAAFMH